jgi:hypothetical protein
VQRLLAERGIASEVANFAESAGMISDAVCGWHESVFARSPDVLIIHYGGYECTPKVLPRWFEAKANHWHYHGGRAQRLGRSVVQRLWKYARLYQREADRRIGTRGFRMSPDRFRWEFEHFLGLTRGVGDPLILVMDLHRFGSRYTFWIPSINERQAIMQETLKTMVEEMDGVRLIPIAALIERLGGKAMPDGVHFSAEVHVTVAEMLVVEIVAGLHLDAG